MKDLRDIKCFLLDMDGTFYLGNTLIDGALDFLDVLKKQNKEFNFLTNNSSKNKSVYDKKDKPDYVVLGFDTTITYEKIWTACDYLRDGIPFIATHPDFNCPLENNKYMPDTGSMIKMFEASAEVSPLIIGKPSKYIVDAVMEKYGLEKEEVAIVGDRLYTDIKTGENAGITSILVLSGETSEKMYMNSDIHADYVFSSIKDIGEKLKKV